MSQLYERELKGILMADPEVLKRVTHGLPQHEAVPYMELIHHPFVVVRAAGSFGIDMAVIGIVSFLVEEKTSIEEVYHFNSQRIIDQAEELKRLSEAAGVTPVYAYRRKGVRGKDPWRLFTMELDVSKLVGYQSVFHNKLKKLEYTRNNNYIMRWKNGWPLHEFIAWANFLPRGDYEVGESCPPS